MDEKINTYIDGKKFQFITDFSKHACVNTNGESMILDFGDLTIYERIMLSSYLTILCDGSKMSKDNLYDKIFNFNFDKKYRKEQMENRKTNYHDPFISDISSFIKEKPHFFAFIKDNFDKIENDKTFIFRSQLNASEMNVLYSLQFRKSYKSLMNVLYIIGVSKQNISTTKLNKIPLQNFYATNVTLSEKRVNEIFKKINSISKNEVQYKISKNNVYFGSGFDVDLSEKYTSNEMQKFITSEEEEMILKSLNNNKEVKEEKEVNEVKEVKKVHKVKKIDNKPNVGNLDELELDKDMCLDYLNNHQSEFQNFANMFTEPNALKKIGISNECQKINEMMKRCLSSEKDDVCLVYHNGFIKGTNGLDRKRTAEYEIIQIRKKIFKYLTKLYDEDKEKYKYVLNFFLYKFEKILEF